MLARSRSVYLHGREASMARDDHFCATTDVESEHELIAFENDSAAAGEVLPYKFGAVGYGWAGGVVGCGGTAFRRLLNGYSGVAGVHGTARDLTGVAGTSLNSVGVYGQVEDGVLVPNRLRAGVFGASTTQPGTIGFSQINEGAQGLSFAGFGMKGRSD